MKVSLLKAVIFAAVPIGSMAQGQDANYKWVGNDISTVINSTEVDMTTVYLKVPQHWFQLGYQCVSLRSGDASQTDKKC